MELASKLAILADAAKYDASCASSGGTRRDSSRAGGGRGGILGTFFAVMLLQVLRNIFNLLGLGSFYQMTVTGLIIVAAILLNRFIDLRRGRGWTASRVRNTSVASSRSRLPTASSNPPGPTSSAPNSPPGWVKEIGTSLASCAKASGASSRATPDSTRYVQGKEPMSSAHAPRAQRHAD